MSELSDALEKMRIEADAVERLRKLKRAGIVPAFCLEQFLMQEAGRKDAAPCGICRFCKANA